MFLLEIRKFMNKILTEKPGLSERNENILCFSCNALVPDVEGLVHKYLKGEFVYEIHCAR